MYHGRGGYDWYTIYNMPVWLRNATYKFIEESIDQENKANEKAIKSSDSSQVNLDWSNPDKTKVNLPSHISRASKK